MSDSLGNYEPKNLKERTGPGEGGRMNCNLEDFQFIFLFIQ